MKLPRDLNGAELIKLLCKHHDYRRVNQEGSHVLLETERPRHHRLAVPDHDPLRACDRATEFGQRCRQLEITGVTLHSYRYAWAERAKTAGYPERFAQEALGHNSKAVHRACAKRALMKLPSLEDYEQQAAERG